MSYPQDERASAAGAFFLAVSTLRGRHEATMPRSSAAAWILCLADHCPVPAVRGRARALVDELGIRDLERLALSGVNRPLPRSGDDDT